MSGAATDDLNKMTTGVIPLIAPCGSSILNLNTTPKVSNVHGLMQNLLLNDIGILLLSFKATWTKSHGANVIKIVIPHCLTFFAGTYSCYGIHLSDSKFYSSSFMAIEAMSDVVKNWVLAIVLVFRNRKGLCSENYVVGGNYV